MARPDVVECRPLNTKSSISRIDDAPVIQEPSLAFLQDAENFSIHDGSIASIGGDSFTARGDVHVTINHNYPSSLNSSSTSLNIPNAIQEERVDAFAMQSRTGMFSEDTFSRTPLPVQRSCTIYRRHLEAKGRGISLWIPEPSKNLPKQYQRNGIAIGDVGIITSSGSFQFLFNVCLPKGHPINPRRMPDGFEPLSSDTIQDFDISVQRELKENSYLASVSSVRVRRNGDSTGLVFESSEQDGAILTMPVGAKSEDLNNVVRFRKYVSANMKSWYQYAYHDRGFEIHNGDLRVITGTDKTSAWGMATFSNSGAGCSSTRREPASPVPGGEPKFHLEFGLIENGDGASDRQVRKYGWEYSGVAEVRAGPDAREVLELRGDDPDNDDDVVYENQCLFIRTLNTTLPERIWEQLGIDEEEDFGCGYGYDSINGSSSSSSSGRGGNSSSGSGTNQGGNFLSSGSHHQVASTSNQTSASSFWRPMYNDSPSMALADHPSNAINHFLLQNCSQDTTMAVTLDQDWISVLREDDFVLPSSEELLERIIESYDIREEDGIVFLDAKFQAQDVMSDESSGIAILYSEETADLKSTETSESLEGLDFDLFPGADPNISNSASILKRAYQMMQNVKVHQQKCRVLCDRSEQLLRELQALGTKAPDIVYEVDSIVAQILHKAEAWSSWSSMKSFLRQGEIRQDIETLGAGIDSALAKISILGRPLRPLKLKGVRDRDKPGFCDDKQSLPMNANNTSRSVVLVQDHQDQSLGQDFNQNSPGLYDSPLFDFSGEGFDNQPLLFPSLADDPDAICQYLFRDVGHNPYFEWSRHLPDSVALDRRSHDRALDILFELSASWFPRIVPALFLKNMYQALSVPAFQSTPETAHYSPMLHNVLVVQPPGFLYDLPFNDPKTGQHYASRAQSLIKTKYPRPNSSAVGTLSILAAFHSFQDEDPFGDVYSEMSARMSQWILRQDNNCFEKIQLKLHEPLANLPITAFSARSKSLLIWRRVMDVVSSSNFSGREPQNVINMVPKPRQGSLPPDLRVKEPTPQKLMIHLAHWWLVIQMHCLFFLRQARCIYRTNKQINHSVQIIMALLPTWCSLYSLNYSSIIFLQIVLSASIVYVLAASQVASGVPIAQKEFQRPLDQQKLVMTYLYEVGRKFWQRASNIVGSLKNSTREDIMPILDHETMPTTSRSSSGNLQLPFKSSDGRDLEEDHGTLSGLSCEGNVRKYSSFTVWCRAPTSACVIHDDGLLPLSQRSTPTSITIRTFSHFSFNLSPKNSNLPTLYNNSTLSVNASSLTLMWEPPAAPTSAFEMERVSVMTLFLSQILCDNNHNNDRVWRSRVLANDEFARILKQDRQQLLIVDGLVYEMDAWIPGLFKGAPTRRY